MIKAHCQEEIVSILAAILTYGLEHLYSPKAMEERLLASSFLNDLERNEYDIESTAERVIESVYGVHLPAKADISYKGLFLAQSYFSLFLSINRSFEYLFLYWPLSRFLESYGVYHEMDFSNLLRDFQSQRGKTPLLKKLCQEKKVKISDLPRLSGINGNSIDKYARDDRYLAGASVDVIYGLAMLFGVKMNLFASDLGVYLDFSAYLGFERNRDYRNLLGFYYANLFDSRIEEKDFFYEASHGIFLSKKDGRRILVHSLSEEGLGEGDLAKEATPDTYLILFDNSLPHENAWHDLLKGFDCFEAMVIQGEFAYLLKRGRRREITDTIARSLQIRASRLAKSMR